MDKKILIIEDEQAIQKILMEPLTFEGYQVTAASDGLEGINKFHEQDFDLILLDIMLPKIDGYTVCEMIRQESQILLIRRRIRSKVLTNWRMIILQNLFL